MISSLDTSILINFQKGHQRAFNRVFEYYYRQILFFCTNLIGSPPDAEEIASETFSKLFERHQHFNSASNIKAFLYITARNACFNHLRDTKRMQARQGNLESEMDVEDIGYLQQIKGEVLNEIYYEVRQLPQRCKKIFELLYFEDLTPAQVAEQLGISIDTVYSQKRHALKILRLAVSCFLLAFYLLRKMAAG